MDANHRTCCGYAGFDPADIGWGIEQHGLFLVRVTGAHPGEVPWTYTIGNHEHGLPELVVFGLPRRLAEVLLTELSEDLRGGTLDPRPGALAVCPPLELTTLPLVRLGAVAPRWGREMARLALHHYGAAAGVDVLQVVVPDGRGRPPSDPACSAWVRQEQPDLSRDGELAWPTPYFPRLFDLEPPPGDIAVTVPILAAGRPAGRVEAVPARRDGDDRATLAAPPVLADWVTAGAVVETGRPIGAARAPAPSGGWSRPLTTGVRLAAPSPDIHLAWSYAHSCASLDALVDARRRLESYGVALTDSYEGLHVAAPARAAERVRIIMRRLVRDGHAVELSPYHGLPTPGRAAT